MGRGAGVRKHATEPLVRSLEHRDVILDGTAGQVVEGPEDGIDLRMTGRARLRCQVAHRCSPVGWFGATSSVRVLTLPGGCSPSMDTGTPVVSR